MKFILEVVLLIIFLVFILFFMTWPISLPILIIYLIKKNKNKKYFKSTVLNRNQSNIYFSNIQDTYIDISDYKLEWFDTNDLDVLKSYFGNMFLDFERAYNNVDYNALYNLCSPSLYDIYKNDLNVNLRLGDKKIIDNVSIEKLVIYNTTKNDDEQKVYVMLELKSNNYVMNTSGKVISGNPVKPQSEEFIVTYVKSLKKKDEKSSRCPNCGATVTSTKCSYCNTEFKQNEFRIDTIRKLV